MATPGLSDYLSTSHTISLLRFQRLNTNTICNNVLTQDRIAALPTINIWDIVECGIGFTALLC
jgi:hypothetical protein